ncbi:hypothetical protein KFK09_022867 [Dendrobium nobile]|uniref:Uncharacterized protein n=1 Tax=Dendrobium nobile TaxID=94219 RepID=A0A8T3AJW1_DENNO|nr:hypothetical protein KFK09_022867 [Dendrobium nobile]
MPMRFGMPTTPKLNDNFVQLSSHVKIDVDLKTIMQKSRELHANQGILGPVDSFLSLHMNKNDLIIILFKKKKTKSELKYSKLMLNSTLSN